MFSFAALCRLDQPGLEPGDGILAIPTSIFLVSLNLRQNRDRISLENRLKDHCSLVRIRFPRPT